MIGKIQDPDRPGEEAYVPLHWHDEAGRWVVPGTPRSPLVRFSRRMDAAVSCWVYVRARYHELARSARLMRVMCEHPEFDFEGDAVSAAMVRERAQALSLAVSREEEDIERLLDAPRLDDVVYIRGERYVLDPQRTRLEPRDRDVAPAAPEPPQGPWAGIEWLVEVCTLFAEELTGQDHTREEVEAMVSRVQQRLREGDGSKTEH